MVKVGDKIKFKEDYQCITKGYTFEIRIQYFNDVPEGELYILCPCGSNLDVTNVMLECIEILPRTDLKFPDNLYANRWIP